MFHFLVDHAIKNVWCSPNQDNQLIFSPKRISPVSGSLNFATVIGNSLELPVKKIPVHLFQVGQLDPYSIGLLQQTDDWRKQKWFKFSDAVNAANIDISIYDSNGIMLPNTECYYIFLDERALIFAVPNQPKIPIDLETEQIYFRFYRNNFFKTSSLIKKSLKCGAFKPTTVNQILDMETALASLVGTEGQLRLYLNGILIDDAVLGNVKINDTVEWVFDSSVKKIIEWKLSDLHQFRSELDNTYKYLLHYQGLDFNTIDYQDDIDFYIIFKQKGKFNKGAYFNRNLLHSQRMVTHRDYSINTENVITIRDNLATALKIITPVSSEVFVRAIVREGGKTRPLVYENQRIFELYKLNEENRLQSLIGINSTVPEWNCAKLENSPYVKLMGVPISNLTLDLVQDAYGYNACSVLLGNSPIKTEIYSGFKIAKLPFGLQKNSTIYEFDKDGYLLGFFQNVDDNSYEASSLDCCLIEGVVGLPSITTDSIYGQDAIPMPITGTGYRVYKCYKHNGLPNNLWVDITGSEEYNIINGKLKWTAGGSNHWLMVRSDKNILAYDYEIIQADGLLGFSLMENTTGNPVDEMTPLNIPLGQLDIWLNKRKLIQGLDFFVKFPQVYITNKTFLLQPVITATQKLHIRMMGFPSRELEMIPIEDTGWILNASLSNNSYYDLHDDKVLQINVGGSIKHKDDILFAESKPSDSVINNLNGLPYQIKDIVIPMRNFATKDAYELRNKSRIIDKRISDYMTIKFGKMESVAVSAITARYPVVSPFISCVINLLTKNSLRFPSDRLYDNVEVIEICKPYIDLLNWDPLKDEYTPDTNFSFIIPHANETPFTLDFLSYRFLKQVLEIYGQDKIKISDYINITKE